MCTNRLNINPPPPLFCKKIGGRNSQFGTSLIELIMFIVIVSVALAGILLVMNTVTRSSADPLIHKQALAIAESLLEEIELMPFTFCDPDDANAASAVAATGGCAVAANEESILPLGTEGLEGRYTPAVAPATLPFDNVSDYHGFSMPSGTVLDITGANTGLNGYAAAVVVAQHGLALGLPTDDEAMLITVTVTGPNNLTVAVDGIRTRYSPRGVP